MKKVLLSVFTVALLLMVSCETKDWTEDSAGQSNAVGQRLPDEAVQLQNPYSVTNMLIAYADLLTDGDINRAKEMSGITTTHYYVKFRPENEETMALLKQDSTLVFYNYPLDVSFPEGFDLSTYRDEGIPEDQPGFQYASVPVNRPMPEVPHEILEELFIPDEEKIEDGKGEIPSTVILNGISADELVDRSLLLTGNYEEENGLAAKSKWRPAGRITMQDDLLGTIGVEGLKVEARRWFTTHVGFVNSAGYYSCDGTFKNPANYSYKYERYDFEIRKGWIFSTAKLDGPKKTGNWDVHHGTTSIHSYYSTIFRAAHHYYYKNIQGLRRPPQNGFWRTQLKIKAVDEVNNEYDGNANPARRFLGLGSHIHIFNPQNPRYRTYATTIHELTHASHWSMSSSNNYRDADKIVIESWARGVERSLTRMVYTSYEPSYNRLRYTGMVHDALDGFKTRTSSYYFTDSNPYSLLTRSYQDQVSGYTIRQMEDALQNQKKWDGWKNNIKNMFNNSTENNLDATFAFWNTQ
ncbi:hypothetical protein [Flavobacterium cerinum]|uniref:Lipoprotein n=1 Tax=Flavobacterium cerinum TaxID=2502784 RepID=A0ABY5IM74_9FLAO|nr:hypothetical protein [Flavobacterium cerinum]UUC43885.1 hypothetical protein NOX80_09590 [Flavobacterium cerinum]